MSSYVPTTEWLVHDWHQACVAAETLCIQRCASCGTWRHPPRRYCAECASPEASFEPVAGTGRVLSKSVSHRSLDPDWQAQAPYATLVVELDEGPRVLAATRAAATDVALGDRVRCSTEARSEDFVLVWADPDPTA